MKGIEGHSAGMLMICAIAISGVVTLGALIRSLRFILLSSDGRKERAMGMLTVSLKRLIILVMLGYAGNYLLDVRLRWHASAWHCVHSDMDKRYVARYAYLWNDKILLRLYDAGSKRILAERTYAYLGPANVLWTSHLLIYDTFAEGNDGEIVLPPSLYDRITAWLT